MRNKVRSVSLEHIRQTTRPPPSSIRLSLDSDKRERHPRAHEQEHEHEQDQVHEQEHEQEHEGTHLLESDWHAHVARAEAGTRPWPRARARAHSAQTRWPRRLQVAALLVCSVLTSWLWRLLRAAGTGSVSSSSSSHAGLEVSPSSRASDAEAPPQAPQPRRLEPVEAPAPRADAPAPRGEQPQHQQQHQQQHQPQDLHAQASAANMWKGRKSQAWRWAVDVLIYSAETPYHVVESPEAPTGRAGAEMTTQVFACVPRMCLITVGRGACVSALAARLGAGRRDRKLTAPFSPCWYAVLGLLAAVEYGYMPSPRTGFYCNDPKINFKFNGDTVTIGILLSGSFIFPLLALWFVEAGLVHAHRGGCGGLWHSLRAGARPAARWYREFLLGLGVVMFVTDAMKLLVSEPRPHFLDTCRPDAALNCSSPTQWIDDFACTNQQDTKWAVRDSMRSFPSGHTSISVFTALYVMIFLRRRMLRDVTLLLVPWLQGLFLLWALVCSLTRITDHRHHWWDVMAGSVVGVASAFYTVSTLSSTTRARRAPAMFRVRMFCDDFCPRHEDDGGDSLSSSPGVGRGDAKGLPSRPLLLPNGHAHAKDCACAHGCPCPCPPDLDAVPARRLLSSSSSCASSLTAAEERELREVSATS
ncbi:Phospholipid phosphatase 1 [Frankliniella fusca]|uniref:Phospholipid phosphatase 1 n=1 Tax=Frankliniella fusca TaxID=407009 RepID=A0AAE1HTH1_9NEOP|nr:Phospholipid phosphatase 1 [Frankliniella fusca]